MGLTVSYGAFVLERCLQLNLEALSPLDSWKHCYLKLQEGLLHRDHPGLRVTCPQSTSAAPGPAGRLELAMGWNSIGTAEMETSSSAKLLPHVWYLQPGGQQSSALVSLQRACRILPGTFPSCLLWSWPCIHCSWCSCFPSEVFKILF